MLIAFRNKVRIRLGYQQRTQNKYDTNAQHHTAQNLYKNVKRKVSQASRCKSTAATQEYRLTVLHLSFFMLTKARNSIIKYL